MRRKITLICLVAAVVMMGATCAGAETLRSSTFGFEVTIPEPATVIKDEFDENIIGTDFSVRYQCRNILIDVSALTGEKPASVSIAEGRALMNEIDKTSGHSSKALDFATTQDVHAIGSESISQGNGKRSNDKPGLRRKWDELADQMFGDSACCIVLALPLNENKGTFLSMWIWGPGNNAAGVEKAAKTLVESIKIDSLSGPSYVMNKSIIAPAKRVEVKLNKGEMDLRGVVTAIDLKKKTLEMRVREVTEFGKKPVKLNPERSKTVLFEFVPSDVQVNSDVVVVGKSAGAGKPMKASLVLVQPEITK